MKSLKLLLALALLTVPACHVSPASALSLRVVVLSHPSYPQGYVTQTLVRTALYDTIALHNLHGAPYFSLKDIRIKRDPAPQLDNLGQQTYRLTAIRNSRLHATMRRNVDYVYYVVSPQPDSSGVHFMGGVASGTCVSPGRSGLAIGQMRDFNDLGLPRALQSTVIMTHELGHLIGMSHVPSPTIMNADALGLIPALQLRWDEANNQQMAACSCGRASSK